MEIVGTEKYAIQTDKKSYLWYNRNKLLKLYKYATGGKTGYTDEAGRTLVTFGKKGDKTIVVAVFGASSSGSQDVRYTDAINLFEYSFNNFSKQTIAEAANYNFNYINTDKKFNYTLGLQQDVTALLANNALPNVSYTLNIDDSAFKNFDEKKFNKVPAGKIVFNITTIDGKYQEISQDLYLKGIQKYTVVTPINIIQLIIIILAILFILVIFFIIYKTKNKTSLNNKSRKNRRIK